MQRRRPVSVLGGDGGEELSPSSSGGSFPKRTRRKTTFFQNRRRRLFLPPQAIYLMAAALCCAAILILLFMVLLQNQPRVVLPEPTDPDLQGRLPNASDWPLTHIIHTRFMQEQADLKYLGRARLLLFQTFCFPTMVAQTNQQFLWIIQTDPHLSSDLLQELIQLLQPYDHFFLVASNRNFLIHPQQPGSWRDGAEGIDLLQSKIYTGNTTLLTQALALRNERPVLETRLDADDGLHRLFVEFIQQVALKRFHSTHHHSHDGHTTPKWLYWCSRRHLEWHADSTATDKNTEFVGALVPIQHEKLCITPGMTVGYNVGTLEAPLVPHDLLYKQLHHSHECYSEHSESASTVKNWNSTTKPKSSCLEFVDELLFVAIRSRTLTSAGMRNIDASQYGKQAAKSVQQMERKLWEVLEDRFEIGDAHLLNQTQSYLQDYSVQIAQDNLKGQCTSGHSCKEQAKQDLQKIIIAQQQQKGGKHNQLRSHG